MSADWPEPSEPSPRAVKCGRVVFGVVGVVFLAIGGWFGYVNPTSQVVLTSAVLTTGLVLVWLGFSLPPRVVAHAGFWLPIFLP